MSGHGDQQGYTGRIVAAWMLVGVPLAYGVVETVRRAAALFTG